MLKGRKNIVFQIVTNLEHERPLKGVPPNWNLKGEAYEAIFSSFGKDTTYIKKSKVLVNDLNYDNINKIAKAIDPEKLVDFPDTLPIIDFSNYRIEVNIFDPLVPSLIKLTKKAKEIVIILIPAGYFSLLQSSQRMKDLRKYSAEKKVLFLFLEPDGTCHKYGKNDNIKIGNRIKSLSDLLNAPSEDEFRNLLIKKSHRWFGHFEMPSGPHVRTHYDCYQVILHDDWIYKFVSSKARVFIDKIKPDYVIGFGLMHDAVAHITQSIAEENHLPVTFYFPPPEYIDLHTGHRILLISDVVLTSKSANDLLNKIEKMGALVVGLLCVIRFSNSSKVLSNGQPITHIIEIPRPFYRSNSDCPLCACQYPLTTIKTVDDFKKHPEKINSYDFWEAVHESKAFKNKHFILNGRHYSYFVDVKKLLGMYSQPIVQQILSQTKSLIGSVKPSAILYPEGDSAALFANQISDEWMHSTGELISVIMIPREYLNTFQQQAIFQYPKTLDMDKILNQNVIIADDACATFQTFSTIQDFLRRSHAKILAYFVVLNRSYRSATESKIKHLKGFQSFYNWPVPVYQNYEKCPECQSTRK
jgi:orotate phosphoribosyltransferase